MIIETPYKDGDVVTLKMVGGDEVIARLEKELDSYLVVTRPLLVVLATTGFAFQPYILTVGPETSINLRQQTVITVVKSHDAIMKQYVKQTSGLVI